MCLKNISSYDGKVNHSFRDYKADDRKSLPRITRRRLQEFINLFQLRMTHSWNGCAASPAAAFVQNGYTVAGAGMLLVAAWHVIHDKTDYVDFQKQDRQSPASNG